MQRLAGNTKTDPVIQLQTAFGGGKTHTLLALYHLLKKPNEVSKLPQIKNLVSAAGVEADSGRERGMPGRDGPQPDLEPHLLGRDGLPTGRGQAVSKGCQER